MKNPLASYQTEKPPTKVTRTSKRTRDLESAKSAAFDSEN
jgi:hypothetical protein